jgi:hypothetical protein
MKLEEKQIIRNTHTQELKTVEDVFNVKEAYDKPSG